MAWIPLHVHSQYSILSASASVKDIAKKASEWEMPAVALTDHGNLYGAVDFFKACQAQNVKPIIGCDFYVAPGSRFEKTRAAGGKTAYRLVLLAKDRQGYHNLCKLSSHGFLEGFYYHPRIDKELLQQHSKGLICLSDCVNGSLGCMPSYETMLQEAEWFLQLFGQDYFLEIQRHAMTEADMAMDGMDAEPWLVQNHRDWVAKQALICKQFLSISEQLGIPLVATNDSHYILRDDWKAHEILLNVQSGEPCEIWERDSLGNPKVCVPNPKRRCFFSHEFYFKSQKQMQQLFADLPTALSNTLEIANRCQLELDFATKHYPVYVPPSMANREYTQKERARAAADYLAELCEQGIGARYTKERLASVQAVYPERDPMQVVRSRLQMEFELVTSKGMCDYLLIVYDFIHWAKEQNIPMGPGRGSGVGSIILYLIGITDIEPLRFHLFFERFINPERLSYPDIDVDICMDRRNEVIEYTLQKYGRENVAQIITFGTMKAKMAIKDVGRVLSIPLSKVNGIAKLVPEDPNMTLDKALDTDPELLSLYQNDKEAQRIIDLGKRLEGSIRNTGLHAAGVIISGEPLQQHIPVCSAKDSQMAVTQYSMKPVEQVGMLKIDFLGLKTLTCIQLTCDAVADNYGVRIPWTDLPLDDAKTFQLLNQGQTLGVFQLESGGMRELARQLHIDKFEEIIAVGSLYRPGPMEMIPSFIARKHGKEPIEYDHEWMKDILSETYGIMVYQEQVMQIARMLAGYSLGEGDVLRRAMGKKDMAEMVKQREKFRIGAKENGIEEEVSMRIFDKMEKFASYGFNKSHAAAYGYLSYTTAYLKAHYPIEWMAALMTCDKDDLSKVAKFIRECDRMNIKILPPDVNEGGRHFLPTKQGIRFALCGIKGVGEGVVEAILEEKKRNGPYNNLFDFIMRLGPKKTGKKVVEQLVDAGAFDFTTWSRDALRLSVEPMYEAAIRQQKERAGGVLTFFDLMGQEISQTFLHPPVVKEPTAKMQQLIREKELLGFFLTGHPMDAYSDVLAQLSCVPLHEVEKMPHDAVFRAALLIESVETRISAKTGKKFAITMVSDGMDRFELPIWADLYEEQGSLLKENQLIYAVLSVDKREDSPRLSARWLGDLQTAGQATIEACDRAYDKAKNIRSKMANNKNSALSAAKTKERPVMNKPAAKKPQRLRLHLHADVSRLSHILQLKKIFRSHPGALPVDLHFVAGKTSIGIVSIENPWGVNPSPELLSAIKSLPCVAEVENS